MSFMNSTSDELINFVRDELYDGAFSCKKAPSYMFGWVLNTSLHYEYL